MIYGLGDTAWTTLPAAVAAIVASVLTYLTARGLKAKVEPIPEQLRTIQVNTNGRLAEVLDLLRAQHDATVTGRELSPSDKARVRDAIGETQPPRTVPPSIAAKRAVPVEDSTVTRSTTKASDDYA